MVLRPLVRVDSIFRAIMIGSLLVSGVACATVDEGTGLANLGRSTSEPIRLPEAEHMIDELDRVMTAYGTISIKTPDVWGQDRLAKFRSEYESQMAGWLKQRFKGDINASLRHNEVEATQVQVGGECHSAAAERLDLGTTTVETVNVDAISKSQAALNASTGGSTSPPDKTPVALEPTVVLDEHSNYLNHLNQLRRINAGDDLTDRPGYGLYLVRIPVTLSPGPRSRRGKGAIITVSAKSVMTKHTLRARTSECGDQRDRGRPDAGDRQAGRAQNADQNPGRGNGDILASVLCRYRALPWRGEHRLAQERGRAPARQ